jgi:hypothetical protein
MATALVSQSNFEHLGGIARGVGVCGRDAVEEEEKAQSH